MSLMRGKLLAGALFAGALFAHGEQVEAQVPQPLSGGGFVREYVKYEPRTLKAHTFQQLRQESGARLYAIDNALSASAISQQKLRSAELGYCETELATSPPEKLVAKPASLAKVEIVPSVEISTVSTHYQYKQASTAFAETEQIAEPHYVKSSESVIRLQQVSSADISVSEIPVVKQSLTTEVPTISLTSVAWSVIRLQQASSSEAFVSLVEIPVVREYRTTAEAATVIRLQQQSISEVFISDNIVDEHANNKVIQHASIVAKCKQYQPISQATSGKCEVSDDDEEMMMVLLLLESMDS